MTTTITEHDKKLLVFLAIFLILAIGLVWVIQPAMEDISEMQEEISDAELLQEQNQQKVDGLTSMLSGEQAMEGAVTDLQSNIYPVMNTADIGDIMTGLAANAGADLTAMDIAIPDSGDYTDVKTYYGDAAIEGTTCYGIYDAAVSVNLTGSAENLRAFLAAVSEENGKLLVRQYTWSGSGGEQQLSVTISLFMAETLDEYNETRSTAAEDTGTAADSLTLQ